MDRVEDQSNDPQDEPEAAPDELPKHGEEQPDAEVPVPVDDEAAAETTAEEPSEVETLTTEVATLREKLLRVEAEFMNETKRIRRKADDDRKYAIEKVVVDLLPVLDALHGARDALGESEAADSMREGLALVEKQLGGVFERYGIAAIEALGKAFDPARHQAMMMIENPDFDPQTVCNVMRQGYELNGRVIRPAEVVVVKAPAVPVEEAETAGDEVAGEAGDA